MSILRSKRIKILVIGIGGVGGYFGGLLAKQYGGSEEIEIAFLARGQNLEAIRQSGLTVKKGNEEFTVRPHQITDRPEDIGVVDYILICTKSYDLEETMRGLAPCIGQHTVIVPLLNGVNIRERILNLYPDNVALYGCAYIVARLTAAGQVENLGNNQRLFFGLDATLTPGIQQLEMLMKNAGINATATPHILKAIWEKFIFLAPFAASTCYYNSNAGEIKTNLNLRLKFIDLVAEVALLAQKKGIEISSEIIPKTISQLDSLKNETTSSLHSDLQLKKQKNELETLIGYVVSEAGHHQIEVNNFAYVYADLKQEIASFN